VTGGGDALQSSPGRTSGSEPWSPPAWATAQRRGGWGDPGFTLVEVLMVVVLLGVLAALTWPDFSAAARAEHLQQSAQRIRSLVAMCRAEAMNQTCRYRILIRPDGSLRVRRQADPIKAPHLYITPPEGWARTDLLLKDVWVSDIQVLPEGPPPIRIIDDKLEFPEMEINLVPVEELEEPVEIKFDPDGQCNSMRWVLRDGRGRGLLVTLDGRLGRVSSEAWEALPADQVRRPEPVAEEKEPEYVPEDHE